MAAANQCLKLAGRTRSFSLSRNIQEVQNVGLASYRKMPNCAGETNLDSIISAYEGLAFDCDLETRRASEGQCSAPRLES